MFAPPPTIVPVEHDAVTLTVSPTTLLPLNATPVPVTVVTVVKAPLAGVVGVQVVPFHPRTCPVAGAVFATDLPCNAPTVVATVPAAEVTSPVKAGILAAATVPL